MNSNYEDSYTELEIPNLDFSNQDIEIIKGEFLKESKVLIKV